MDGLLWRSYGWAHLLGALGVSGLWLAVTATSCTGGIVYDWLASGAGVLVIGYLLAVAAAGVQLLRGRCTRWVAGVDLLAVPVLLTATVLSWMAPTGGGDPAFYIGLTLVSALACLAALIGGVAVLRRSVA